MNKKIFSNTESMGYALKSIYCQ